jgi:N-ethylmaleimide reductase
MNSSELLSPYTMGNITLKNRIVMAPMTRSRALSNVPNELMAEFYEQRSAAGLIITEGTSPSPNGLGYSRIPGIFNQLQVDGWKRITDSVHSRGGKIFVQLMHTGRISHPANMLSTATIFAPSAVRPAGQMWTDALGLQDFPVPTAMTVDGIQHTKEEYVTAAVNAMRAGCDGVELHGANGYLLEEFLSPASNTRVDEYGGNIGNRCRFLLEVAQAVMDAIGKERVGVRLSPYGIASDMPHYPEIEGTYTYLAERLDRQELLYLHIVDHSSMGAPEVPASIKKDIRNRFRGTIILSGGYTIDRAEMDLQSGMANLIAFGRPFINNPDLVERFVNGWPLSKELDTKTFYSPGEQGYTDYPVYLASIGQTN